MVAMDREGIRRVLGLCGSGGNRDAYEDFFGCAYFIDEYVSINDEGERGWIPFKLWRGRAKPGGGEVCEGQWDVLKLLFCHGRVSILKARQLGITWLCLACILWHVVFRPGVTVMLYSLRETEARALLRRLRGMYRSLPDFFKAGLRVEVHNESSWGFTNGTRVEAFSTESGDSYQASIVLIDEATLVHNLGRLLGRIKPVVDSVEGGQLWLVSRSNKDDPLNAFNRIFEAGYERYRLWDGEGVYPFGWTKWAGIFLPWWVAPYRDTDWYEGERAYAERETGHYDDLFSMYPNSVQEALSPSTSNKRIPQLWVLAATEKRDILDAAQFAHLGLLVYAYPEPGMRYVCGVDPAEGLPTSDNSAAVWVDQVSGEEVAYLCGKYTPRELADYVHEISDWYNGAGVLCERMNHGHAVLLRLWDHGTLILEGSDGRNGWVSSTQGKIQMYSHLADIIRDCYQYEKNLEALSEAGVDVSGQGSMKVIHTWELALEVMSIERASLRAPEGHMDDRADAFALAQTGRHQSFPEGLMRADYTMY